MTSEEKRRQNERWQRENKYNGNNMSLKNNERMKDEKEASPWCEWHDMT